MLGITNCKLSKQEPSDSAIKEIPALESRRLRTQPETVTVVSTAEGDDSRDLIAGVKDIGAGLVLESIIRAIPYRIFKGSSIGAPSACVTLEAVLVLF